MFYICVPKYCFILPFLMNVIKRVYTMSSYVTFFTVLLLQHVGGCFAKIGWSDNTKYCEDLEKHELPVVV